MPRGRPKPSPRPRPTASNLGFGEELVPKDADGVDAEARLDIEDREVSVDDEAEGEDEVDEVDEIGQKGATVEATKVPEIEDRMITWPTGITEILPSVQHLLFNPQQPRNVPGEAPSEPQTVIPSNEADPRQ